MSRDSTRSRDLRSRRTCDRSGVPGAFVRRRGASCTGCTGRGIDLEWEADGVGDGGWWGLPRWSSTMT